MGINSFLKLIRLPNLLIIAFTQYMVRWCLIYSILKVRGYELQMGEFDFFLLSLSTVMIAASGYIINDYFDVKIDRINKPEKLLIDKHIKRRVAMGAHIVINIIAISIGVLLAYKIGVWKLGIIYFICAGGLWYYSTSFKRQFLTGNLIIALFTAFIPLIAGVFEILLLYKKYLALDPSISFRDIWTWLLGLSAFAFITTLLREIIKDMEDYQGDRLDGCRTIPIVLGVNKSKSIITVIILLIVGTLGYFQAQQLHVGDHKSFTYFLVLLQLPFVFLIYKIIIASEKKDFHFASSLTKLIMLSGISYLFLFCYSLLSL